jgi:hypothetical protein
MKIRTNVSLTKRSTQSSKRRRQQERDRTTVVPYGHIFYESKEKGSKDALSGDKGQTIGK